MGIMVRFLPALIYAAVIAVAGWGALIADRQLALGVIIVMLIPVAFFSLGTFAFGGGSVPTIVIPFAVFTFLASAGGIYFSSHLIRAAS